MRRDLIKVHFGRHNQESGGELVYSFPAVSKTSKLGLGLFDVNKRNSFLLTACLELLRRPTDGHFESLLSTINSVYVGHE